jgi:hypothetical protein
MTGEVEGKQKRNNFEVRSGARVAADVAFVSANARAS